MTHVEEIVLKLKDQFTRIMGDAEKKTKRVRSQTTALDGQVKKLQKTAMRAFGAFATVQLVKGVAQLGIEMEQTRVAFTTFLGDADKANATIKELNEFSNVTPFDNAQVIKAGKSLLAFGTPAEKLKGQLKAIGDISAGTGKDFNELTTIYGKAQIAGTLYAEDINQLVEAGVPIIGEFAKQMGVSESQVKKLASQGKIGFGNLQQAFIDMTGEGGRFNDLMAKQSQTVGGQISTLKGNLQTLGITIGEALLPTIQAIVAKVQALTTWISANKDTIAAWVPWIVKIVGIIGAVILAIKAWMVVQTILNFLLTANPIGIIIVAIGALIAIIVAWRDKIKEAIESNSMLGIVLKIMFAPIILIVKAIKWLYEAIKNWLQTSKTGQKIVAAFRWQMELLGKVVSAVGNFFTDLPNKALSAFEVIKQKVMGFVDVVRGAIGVIMNPFDEAGRNEALARLNNGLNNMTESAGDIYRRKYKELKTKQAEDEAKMNAEIERKNKATADQAAADADAAMPDTGLGKLAGAQASAKTGVSGGLSSVASSAPKNVTISIEKLVESLNINTTTLKEGTAEIRDEITKALLVAINDSQIQAS